MEICETLQEKFWKVVNWGVLVSSTPSGVETFTDWRINLDRDQFQWYTKDDRHVCYDVAIAKVLLHREPRITKRLVVSSAEILVNQEVGVYTSPRTVDLSVPVILTSQFLPIDGYHRIGQAVREGVSHLPCVLLTPEETKMVEATVERENVTEGGGEEQ